VKHCRSIEELGKEGLLRLLDSTDQMAEINRRPIPKVPALRGKTVVSLFFEDSTRTRLSFETAAKRLSAETITFSVSTSSLNKGESLRDTVETITDMGVHAFVVRHKSAGVPWQIAQWTNASIINDVTIVGDIKHSRVARSNISAFTMLGAQVTLVAPPTLMPAHTDQWPVRVSHSLDELIASTDVLYMLRLQSERMDQGLIPNLGEYGNRFGLTDVRAQRLQSSAVVMHPGPMNRGVEMHVDPADLPNSLIHKQVANGVSVRMAVLFDALARGAEMNSLKDEVAA